MRPFIFAHVLLCGLAPVLNPVQAQAPATPVRPVVDTLHGVPVIDPYRWLEGDSEEVRAWYRAQNAYARKVLDRLPGRAAILERLRVIGAAAAPEVSLPIRGGGRWFYTVRRPGEPTARLYVRDALRGAERLIVDPATVGDDPAAGSNRIATFSPSPDGRLIAYGIMSGGSENVVLRVRDVTSGRDVAGPFERCRFVIAWSPDGRTVLFQQFHEVPPGGSTTDVLRDSRIVRHHIGADAASDVPVFSAAAVGDDPPLLAVVDTDIPSGVAIASLSSGAEFQSSSFFVAALADVTSGVPTWRRLSARADSVGAIAVHGSDLYVLTHRGAPLGRILRTPLGAPDLRSALAVLPESTQSIESMTVALDALYVRTFAEGTNRIVRIPWGRTPSPVALPQGTSVEALRGDPLESGILLTLTSTTSASRAYRFDPATNALEELPLQGTGPYDRLEGFVTETIFVSAHDGVRIPLTLNRPANAVRDGSMPVLLYGYGAYGITDPPQYFPDFRPWAESGGADATCHVRGGGYYGESWHRAGHITSKPNSWLDFISCAEYLVREGYSRPERLAALGLSAGGITVGRAITERPDLFAAAVVDVGLLNTVRMESMPTGGAQTTEFGSVATEEGFRALLAMDAVHHVRPGTHYPAVLLSTGMNDFRVAPWQSAKMAAALQAASTSGRPVLLRADENAGHYYTWGPDELRREEVADWLAFLMVHTGMAPSGSRDH